MPPQVMQQSTTTTTSDHHHSMMIHHSLVLDRQLLQTNCTSSIPNSTSIYNDCMMNAGDSSRVISGPGSNFTTLAWVAIFATGMLLSGLKLCCVDIPRDRNNAREKERKRKDIIENRLVRKRVKRLGSSSEGEKNCHDLENGLGGASVPSPRDCRLQKTDLYLPDAIEERNDDEELACPICWEDYKESEEICYSQNPKCAHSFHFECIKPWLEKYDRCPICRSNYLLLVDGSDNKSHPDASDTTSNQQDELDPNDRFRLASALENTSEDMAEKDFAASNRLSNCTSLDTDLLSAEGGEIPSLELEMEEFSLQDRIFDEQTVDRILTV